MAVNIIWQYESGDYISGEAQDLGTIPAGEEGGGFVMLGHYETDVSIVILTDVGFYINPYDGIYEGDEDAASDFFELLAYGDTRALLNDRGFLINQRGYEIPVFPDAGWVSCTSERGSNPDNAIELLATACDPEAEADGELPLGSVMKLKTMISLPSLVERTGVHQFSMYMTFSFTS